MAFDVTAIKARVATGRAQGGSPLGPDSPFQYYHQALDDLDVLIAEIEARDKAAEVPAEPLEPITAVFPPKPKKAAAKKATPKKAPAKGK